MLKIRISKQKIQGFGEIFSGRVICTNENGKIIWSKPTKIDRLSREEAVRDAENLLENLKEVNIL